jgi:transposase
MRGSKVQQVTMLGVVTPEQLIPAHHPIRRIKPLVDASLQDLEPTLEAMYAKLGRPSIPPEHLLKGCLLMALYSIRSERQFCERLQYDLLFKWFLDLNVEDPAFDHTSFAKNRDRLLRHEVARRFFEAVLEQARRRHLLSSDHFTVDGTLLEAWASLKSFRPRDENDPGLGAGASRGRNPEVSWHGQPRSNATHISKTDPEARLARKGNNQPAKLYFGGHLLMENRNGLAVDVLVTEATGYAEREAGLEMLGRYREGSGRGGCWTVGADKGYDVATFVDGCRELGVTPHVAQNTSNRRSAIDHATAGAPGYEVSQRVRKRVEEIMGWVKVVGGGRKLRYLGVEANQLWAEMTTTAYNLIRIGNLIAEGA